MRGVYFKKTRTPFTLGCGTCLSFLVLSSNAERRFFHYRYIALELGVSGAGRRAKLPACVQKRIKEMYPDEEGEPTKVGYKQDPSA